MGAPGAAQAYGELGCELAVEDARDLGIGKQLAVEAATPGAGWDVVVDPIEVFTGLLNEPWIVTEEQNDRGPGSVEVRTSIVGEIGGHQWHNAVRTNLQSHQDMLDRAGLAGPRTRDDDQR